MTGFANMTPPQKLRAAALSALTAAIAVIFPAWGAEEGGVTPYRPSLSNPAELPRPGQLELEVGSLHERKGGDRDSRLPYLFKLGFSREWGVLLGGDAYLWSRDHQGERERGPGDTQLLIKRAFRISDDTAFGLELGVSMPAAKTSLQSGKADYLFTGIYSHDIGSLHLDMNFGAKRIGAPAPGAGRLETAFAAGLSLPLGPHWAGIAELSAVARRGVSTTGQLLAALAYSPDRQLTMDVGIARGLNRASQDWSLFTGLVIPVAILW